MKSRYSRYIHELLDICTKKNWATEIIGYAEKPRKFPIYKIVLDAKKAKKKKTISFTAGIHGNETSGPFSIKFFLKQHVHESWMPRIVIIPVANPTGFDADIYRNRKNENINRGYDEKKLTGERAVVFEALIKERPEYFASFHEDDAKKTVYLYGYSQRLNSPMIFRKILEAASRYCQLDTKKKIYTYQADNGLILNAPHAGSLEDKMKIHEVPYVICLEVPDYESLSVRIKTNIAVMKTIIGLSVGKK